MTVFGIETKPQEMLPITRQVAQAVESAGVRDGVCVVYCPHTTAGITINENADPDVRADLLLALDKVFSDCVEFRHIEGNSAAHAKALAVGASATIPVRDGRLVLGRWQGVYFCEFDGPRSRQFYVQVMGEKGMGF